MIARLITKLFPRKTSNHVPRLVMTLLVRNEEDILSHVLEYHRALGIDHFIVTDNLSEDKTPAILENYRQKGWLTVIQEDNDDYDQQAWVTRMARLAATPKVGADWILHCDADEFWTPIQGSLKEYFARLPSATNIVIASRHDFVPICEQVGLWYEKMVYRKLVSLNPRGMPLPPKVAHRPHPNVQISQGNHDVKGFETPVSETIGIEILHFPVRNLQQIENKIIKGGAAYKRNTVQPKSVAIGWRKLYDKLQQEGSLQSHFDEISFQPKEVANALERGDLIEDWRIADFFKSNHIIRD